mgnify:CR=1 FL=1
MFSYIFFTCLGLALGYLLGQRKDIDIRQTISDDIEKLEIDFFEDEMEFADNVAQDAKDDIEEVEAMSPEQQAKEVNNILDL